LYNISNNNSSDDEDDKISILELNTYDDLNETRNYQRAIKNIGSIKKLFEMLCLANLTSCFPNLYVALKLSVTLPISSCSVPR